MSEEERVRLGLRLREAREYAGFSQVEVARHLGVPRSAISLIETGARRLDALELKKLAELYARTVDDLTGAAPNEEDDSVKMVARAAASLTPEDRDEILRFARYIRARKSGDKE